MHGDYLPRQKLTLVRPFVTTCNILLLQSRMFLCLCLSNAYVVPILTCSLSENAFSRFFCARLCSQNRISLFVMYTAANDVIWGRFSTVGDRALSAAVPRAWNSLPDDDVLQSHCYPKASYSKHFPFSKSFLGILSWLQF